VINPDGFPAKILNMVINGKLTINADSRIIDEYNRVLRSRKFSFPEAYIIPLLNYISSEFKPVLPDNPYQLALKDPSDRPFVEVSLYKDIPLITGNGNILKILKTYGFITPKNLF
jgi:hypothetical protein